MRGDRQLLAAEAGTGSCCFTDVFRRGTAAATHYPGTAPGDFTHPTGKFVRSDVIAGFAIPFYRKPRVGIDYNWQPGSFPEFGEEGSHLLGPQPTVEANGICPQTFQHCNSHFNAPASEELPILIEGHGDKYRKVGILLGCQQCGLRLVDVAHSFDEDSIRASHHSSVHHFPKNRNSFFKVQLSQGAQQFPCGTDI